MGLYDWIINKIRNIRSTLTSQNKIYNFGGIYNGNYRNYKKDPTPTFFCMYSDANHTHGINLHYLDRSEIEWFAGMIVYLKQKKLTLNGYQLYNILKVKKYSIIQKAYRKYFTGLLKAKLISSGLTALDKFVYPSGEYIVYRINTLMKQQIITSPVVSAEEIAARITEIQNTIPLNKVTSQGAAPWVKQ